MQAGNDPSVWVNGLSNPSSVSSCLSAGGRWDRLQLWSGKSGKCWTENGRAGHVSSFIDIIFCVRDVVSLHNLWLSDRRPASVDLFLDLIVFDPQHSKNCWCFHFKAFLISPSGRKWLMHYKKKRSYKYIYQLVAAPAFLNIDVAIKINHWISAATSTEQQNHQILLKRNRMICC